MYNPEKLTALGVQDTGRKQIRKEKDTPLYANKHK